MDRKTKEAIYGAVANEPFSTLLDMKLVELDLGFAAVEMKYNEEAMNNIYARAHGGAVYSLIDEAFEAAGQTDGTIAVALNTSVTYISSPRPGATLRAEARLLSRSRKTATYHITARDNEGNLLATCQALAYRTGKPVSFHNKGPVEGPAA